MKKIGLLLTLITTAFSGNFAQSYDTSLGLRLGTDWGITVQHRIFNKTTLEGIIQSSLQREEAMVTLMGEQHFPVISRRFNLYYGGGLHKGWISETNTETGALYRDPFGITFIGGLEITLARLNISYDFKPSINLVGGAKTIYTQTGLSVRYVLDKRTAKENRQAKKRNKKKGDGFNWKFWEN